MSEIQIGAEAQTEEVYVVHVCKNEKLKEIDPNFCDRVFIAPERKPVENTPSRSRYCPECEKKGFKNPKIRQKRIQLKLF